MAKQTDQPAPKPPETVEEYLAAILERLTCIDDRMHRAEEAQAPAHEG